MVGTPIILVRRPINPGLIIDLDYGMIQRSIIRPKLIGLRTKIMGVPTIGLPAVIPLRISMITIESLNDPTIDPVTDPTIDPVTNLTIDPVTDPTIDPLSDT